MITFSSTLFFGEHFRRQFPELQLYFFVGSLFYFSLNSFTPAALANRQLLSRSSDGGLESKLASRAESSSSSSWLKEAR